MKYPNGHGDSFVVAMPPDCEGCSEVSIWDFPDMGFARAILRPAARLAGWHAASQYRAFIRATRAGRLTQERLLGRLIRHHAATRFGREHGFGGIRTYEDFCQAVPVRNYDGLRPYLQAVYEGDVEALFPRGTDVLLFAVTSGTTGRPKHIPVTRQTLIDYRRGWNVFGFKLLSDHPAAWLRSIFQISSPAVESYSPAGVPCGAISGLLGRAQMRIVRRMYVAGEAVSAIADPQAKYYTLMRLAIPRDVAILSTANPSTILKLMAVAQDHLERLLRDLRDGTLSPPGELPAGLAAGLPLRRHAELARRIEQGVARDGRLRTGHFWNLSVLTHWTGGTLGLYLPPVRALTENVPIRDVGLLASEGRFSIPLLDGTPAGAADVTSALLEFIPAEDEAAAHPVTYRIGELETGREYFLVFSNFSGLWRYHIQDRVRVTGWLGQTPLIEFLSKGSHASSITGEKLTEHQVVEAVAAACTAMGLQIQRFCAQGHFADPPYYLLSADCTDARLGSLAEAVDEALQKLNVEYAAKRCSGRLGPVRVTRADPEQFARDEQAFLASRGNRLEQYKPRYLLTDLVEDSPAAPG